MKIIQNNKDMKANKNIGLQKRDIVVGVKVLYYSWVDEENDKHSQPKETVVTSEPWWCGGEWVCKVDCISGGACLSNLALQEVSTK